MDVPHDPYILVFAITAYYLSFHDLEVSPGASIITFCTLLAPDKKDLLPEVLVGFNLVDVCVVEFEGDGTRAESLDFELFGLLASLDHLVD